MGWIGVDLDSCLADYSGWKGAGHIGKPVKAMVNRIREGLADGKDIRIFTARVAPGGGAKTAEKEIKKWCQKHVGQELPVTYKKDKDCIEIWDDRAVSVAKNSGRKRNGGMQTELEKKAFKEGYQDRKVNAPSYAYKAVHGKEPDFFLPGRTGAPKKIWRGVDVDEHMKEDVLERLNDIPGIEGRSSEEGKSEDRPAFFIFRMDPRLEGQAENVAEELRKQNIKSLAEEGQGGRPRIVAAENIKYGDKQWDQWWDELPDKIRKAVLKNAVRQVIGGKYASKIR